MIAWIILLAPLVSAAIILLVTAKSRSVSAIISVAAVAVAFVASCILFGQAETESTAIAWATAGAFSIEIGLLVDPLSKVMLLVVTLIGLLVHVYSLGYMKEDDGKSRYFASLSLFMFSMLGIVLADNFLMMFIFWELVGVSSYLLIGHWFTREAAAQASKKAFILNRIGDFGFLLGILMVWTLTGALGFGAAAAALGESGASAGMLTAAALLIFCGAVGKSAQFPLHVWLPDAMEGPTPVSALIHAATMVAAGVYMLVRASFLIDASPNAQDVIAIIGAVTALGAALIATQQNDIKRILAYSTLSQLGLMVLAVGALSANAAMFHLITHAFFKAMLFLGAGSVILGMHHEQDIWKMGGLKNKMPVTFMTFLIGTLALTGMPFLSGFFSKDLILGAAFAKDPLFFWVAAIASLLTAFYMFRLFVVTFMGKPRSQAAKSAHESPKIMTVPLVLLAIPSVAAGWTFVIGPFYKVAHPEIPMLVIASAVAAFILGTAGAFLLYRGKDKDPVLIPALANKFYVDEIYDGGVKRFNDGLATVLSFFDRWVLDGVVVKGSSAVTWGFGYVLRFLQVGNLQAYSFIFGLGVIGVLYFVIFRHP